MADRLRQDIVNGLYRPGDRLPVEAAVADHFRVSPPVVRQALGVLRSEGLIETRHGRGSFVREQRRLQRHSRKRYGRARRDEQLLTSHLTHDIVSAGREPAPPEVAELLSVAPGDEVIVRRRHLSDDAGRIAEVGTSYIPLWIGAGTFLESPDVVPKALFLCVEDLSGRRYSHARDYWTARLPTASEADTLDLPAGVPVIHVFHVATDSDGEPLEVSESTWPADAIVILDDYAIDQEASPPEERSDI